MVWTSQRKVEQVMIKIFFQIRVLSQKVVMKAKIRSSFSFSLLEEKELRREIFHTSSREEMFIQKIVSKQMEAISIDRDDAVSSFFLQNSNLLLYTFKRMRSLIEIGTFKGKMFSCNNFHCIFVTFNLVDVSVICKIYLNEHIL